MFKSQIIISFASVSLVFLTMACEHTGGGGASGSGKGSSSPINQEEALEYQQAMLRCHKSGGNRIVKIEGELRCY